jgi:hypothetical protein
LELEPSTFVIQIVSFPSKSRGFIMIILDPLSSVVQVDVEMRQEPVGKWIVVFEKRKKRWICLHRSDGRTSETKACFLLFHCDNQLKFRLNRSSIPTFGLGSESISSVGFKTYIKRELGFYL